MTSTTTPAPTAHTTDAQKRFAVALAQYRFARDAMNSLPDDSSAEADSAACDAYTAAEDRLIHTPAVTLEDVRTKAEAIWHDAAGLPRPDEIRAFLADLHNLTNNASSRVFDPAHWLDWFERNGGGWVERDGEVILLIPENGERIEGAMHSLEVHNGRSALYQFIRERAARREAA